MKMLSPDRPFYFWEPITGFHWFSSAESRDEKMRELPGGALHVFGSVPVTEVRAVKPDQANLFVFSEADLAVEGPAFYAASLFAAEPDEPRFYLQGVYVQPHKDGWALYASNGHVGIRTTSSAIPVAATASHPTAHPPRVLRLDKRGQQLLERNPGRYCVTAHGCITSIWMVKGDRRDLVHVSTCLGLDERTIFPFRSLDAYFDAPADNDVDGIGMAVNPSYVGLALRALKPVGERGIAFRTRPSNKPDTPFEAVSFGSANGWAGVIMGLRDKDCAAVARALPDTVDAEAPRMEAADAGAP